MSRPDLKEPGGAMDLESDETRLKDLAAKVKLARNMGGRCEPVEPRARLAEVR